MLIQTVETTLHSIIRAKERLELNEKRAARIIKLAFSRGKCASEFSASERRYLKGKETKGCTAKAYNGVCYIFGENNNCITLYELPAWFGKRQSYNGKEKVRSPRAYLRNTTLAVSN